MCQPLTRCATRTIYDSAAVCVDPEFRGKGVSSVALPDAMNVCFRETLSDCPRRQGALALRGPCFLQVIEASGAPIALLHAAEGVQSLYAKYGFQSLPPISYARLQLDAERSISPPPGVMIRVVVADTADTSALAVVREAFQRRIGVTGFIGRPQAAWAGLVSLVGQLVLATADDGSILAYAIIAKKNGYRIGDFGAADSVSPEAAHAMLVSAARMAIDADISVARAGGPDGAAATPVDSAVNSSIVAPLAILRWLVPAAKPLSDAADGGWMVRATLASGDEGLRVCTALTTAAAEGRFLLVSADGF